MRTSNGVKKTTVLYAAVVFFVVADRFLKSLATQGYQADIVGEILKFDFKPNYYIAFSLPLSGAWLNAVIFLIILFLIFYFVKAWKAGLARPALCLSAVILGAAGNLFDRLKYGYVVDYLDLKYFTVFNLADVMIVAGIFFLLLVYNKKEAA